LPFLTSAVPFGTSFFLTVVYDDVIHTRTKSAAFFVGGTESVFSLPLLVEVMIL